MDAENNFKVRLIPVASLKNGASSSAVRAAQVSFDVTPGFSESRTADYTPVIPIHMPGAVQVYRNTSSRSFEISAILISRSIEDARANMANLQKLRGWMMPYFGMTSTITAEQADYRNSQPSDPSNATSVDEETSAADRIRYEGIQLRGAPPDVLFLYAYSTSSNDTRPHADGDVSRVNINRVPVVMTSLNITYPEDVDYIPVYNVSRGRPTRTAEPFPRKMAVSVTLVETHSPREYERFNLNDYKTGNLVNF